MSETVAKAIGRLAFDTHAAVMSACRKEGVGWERADRIGQRAVRILNGISEEAFPAWWEEVRLEGLRDVMEGIGK